MANTIQDKLAYLEETKEAIKQSIIAKGVSVSEGDTFRSYADKIEAIETGGGTSDCSVYACFDEVGYTFVPKYIQEGLETAKNIKEQWRPNNSLPFIVNQYKDFMVFFPKIDTSLVDTLRSLFESSSILVFPNNDFPALNSEDALEYTFRNCSSLASVDFGSLNEEYVYSLSSTFRGCTSLSRIWVNNPNTRFKLGSSAFRDCSRLDEANCNIFDYFDGFDNIDLSFTFYNSVILKDLTFTNPTSLYNAFYQCNYKGKNITLIYDNYTLTTTSYFSKTFSDASTNEKGGTLKITGNISGDYVSNTLFNIGIYDNYTTSNFETLDITGLVQNNTNSLRYNMFKTLPFDNIIGLDSYIEPQYISEGNHNSMMPLILGNNTLKSFPIDFQTYYYNNSSILGDYQIDASRPLLYNMYQINGPIDLSYISFSPTQMGYFLTNVGNESSYIEIHLDNISFKNVTYVSEGWPANCYAYSIYMPIDFDSYNGDVDLSGLLNWTDHDSLIWSLLTNSTDRMAQSLGTQNLILSSTTYSSLSSDEISQIQAKGYNVSYV